MGDCAKSCARRSVSAVRAVGVTVLVCLRSSCCHVTEVGGAVGFVRLALKVVMQNDGECADILLILTTSSA